MLPRTRRFDPRQTRLTDGRGYWPPILEQGGAPSSGARGMETVKADVAIIGAGGAGLRAAIALAQADPKLRIALISKVYPMRSHTCAAEGGAAGVTKPDDSFD